MSIVHHSNYVRLLEEARVAWLRESGLNHLHGKGKDCLFAVTSVNVKYLKPLEFEDQIEIHLQVKIEGVRIYYQYKIFSSRFLEPVCIAQTEHVPVDDSLQVIRPPREMREKIKEESWTETWL
jgi:acyl-CoA thioester hydrolase